MLAQFRSSYASGLAQFRAAYSLAAGDIAIITDVDAGNIDPALVTIDSTNPSSPIVWLDTRAATNPWRHFLFAVENAEGLTPIFRISRASMTSSGTLPTSEALANMTTDFVTFTRAPARSFGGPPDYIQWQFSDPLPSGRVYIMDRPIGRQEDAGVLAAELLSNHEGIVSPAPSANPLGVYAVSPAETDDLGRQIGGNPMYALRFAWGGATTDGGPKRKLVMFSGIHAAGENVCFIPFRRFLRWVLTDSSQAAQNLRSNWDIYAYWNLNPNGIKGGHRRTTFRSSADPNRVWRLSSDSLLAEITATRAAAMADTGGQCDALISWHGYASQTTHFIPARNAQNSPAMGADVAAFIANGETIFGSRALDYPMSGITNSDNWWGQAALGAKVSLLAELPQRGDSSLEYYEGTGEKWARSLEATDAQGIFWSGAIGALSAASLITATATGTLTTGIPLAGAASSITLATGTLTAQIRLAGAALSQAVAAAGLSTAIQLAAQAQAGAQATGDLSVGGQIDLAGHAQASALATGSLTTLIRFEAAAVARAIAEATLSDAAGAELSGDAIASALAAGDLTTAIRLGAAALASASATGSLSTEASGLSADATVLAIATGGLTTAIPLQGAAVSAVQASGTLDIALELEAQAFVSAMSAGVLSAQIRLDAAAVAGALASAWLGGDEFREGPAAKARVVASVVRRPRVLVLH
ncbi:MAG TPA: hypothetical protein PK177_17645 [Burkholderiaceae bacterium]|nr:hypothetical protein [Burkholderiaceae bacterium]